MKLVSSLLSFLFLVTLSFNSYSQVTSIPEQAKQSFFKQYPDAKNVKWENNVVNVNVRFEQDSNKLYAEYNNKGIWKNTLKDWSYEKLTEDVKEGFKKSKYADRQITDVKMLYLPGYVIQYRLRVEKNDVERKFLFFNTEGRMVRSSVTL
ncbi:MAG: PepSY-like domain-containing protein [Chitinophagaceae bacterium]